MKVNNNELRTTRELVRELNSILALLDDESLDKVVITQSGKMRAVLVSVERAEQLLGDA